MLFRYTVLYMYRILYCICTVYEDYYYRTTPKFDTLLDSFVKHTWVTKLSRIQISRLVPKIISAMILNFLPVLGDANRSANIPSLGRYLN